MIGRKLNRRYKITSLLGEGAMGEVYQATDQLTGKLVAVKVLTPHLITQKDSVERFRREAKTLQQLDHPNIVKYVDSFDYENQYVIVMEYVAGGSLHDLLRRGRLPVEQARQITLDLCDALIRAHRLNIIHRDLKPENILIGKDGAPRLADFGVARLTETTRMTRSGTQVGTPYYMSPEAWEGQKLDAQADIWSLGVVLFEMLAGQVPFGGDTGAAVMTKVLTTPPPDLKNIREEVPAEMERIVGRMLTRDRKERYQTMREVALDLERGQTEPLGKAPQERRTRDIETQQYSRAEAEAYLSPRVPSRLGFIAVGVIAVIALAVAGIVLLPKMMPAIKSVSQISQHPTAPVSTPSTSVTVVAAPSEMSADPKGNQIAMNSVPAGEFTMGSDTNAAMATCKKYRADCDPTWFADEAPPHQVTIHAYYIDTYEVTNALYAACVNSSFCKAPSSSSSNTHTTYFGDPQFDNFPVIYVSWDQATAYCAWRGARLPTEAEWEKAARGTDGRTFPWGEDIDQTRAMFDAPSGDTASVGTYKAGVSPYGVYDMAGNVWEWVADFYSDTFYAKSPSLDPLGPSSGKVHVLRGGSWYDTADLVRTTVRLQEPSAVNNNFGFRCAADTKP